MQLFNADPKILSKNFKLFSVHKNFKKRSSKVAHNWPKPFFPQSSPAHSPQPKIDFLFYEISGPDICSLICGYFLTGFCNQKLIIFTRQHEKIILFGFSYKLSIINGWYCHKVTLTCRQNYISRGVVYFSLQAPFLCQYLFQVKQF